MTVRERAGPEAEQPQGGQAGPGPRPGDREAGDNEPGAQVAVVAWGVVPEGDQGVEERGGERGVLVEDGGVGGAEWEGGKSDEAAKKELGREEDCRDRLSEATGASVGRRGWAWC